MLFGKGIIQADVSATIKRSQLASSTQEKNTVPYDMNQYQYNLVICCNVQNRTKTYARAPPTVSDVRKIKDIYLVKTEIIKLEVGKLILCN